MFERKLGLYMLVVMMICGVSQVAVGYGRMATFTCPAPLAITSAKYGADDKWIDVTSQVAKLFDSNTCSLNIAPNSMNGLFGDSYPKHVKTLIIKIDGTIKASWPAIPDKTWQAWRETITQPGQSAGASDYNGTWMLVSNEYTGISLSGPDALINLNGTTGSIFSGSTSLFFLKDIYGHFLHNSDIASSDHKGNGLKANAIFRWDSVGPRVLMKDGKTWNVLYFNQSWLSMSCNPKARNIKGFFNDTDVCTWEKNDTAVTSVQPKFGGGSMTNGKWTIYNIPPV